MERLPGMDKALGSVPSIKLGTVVQVQGHPQLYCEFKAGLHYEIWAFKKKEEERADTVDTLA